MNISFRNSLIVSVIIQLTAGLITLYALYIPVKDEFNYLYSLVGLDAIVQFVEAFYYLLFIYYDISASNASKLRYFDWFITTPIMILTAVAFFFYNSTQGKDFIKSQPKTREETLKSKLLKPMTDFINYPNHTWSLVIILISNFLMLLTGYIGEIGLLSILNATIIGFVFFFVEFYYIFKDFVAPYGDTNIYIYYTIFTTVWALYGVAYIFNDTIKNISYNILDLISKNIYGLLLAYSIYSLRETL
jgi:bacteriorhodopsin